MTAMLLLNLVGVDREAILVDYEVTESNMRTVFEKQKVMIKEKYGIDVPHCAFSSERFQMETIRIVKSMLVD